MIWSWEFAFSILPRLFDGLLVTIQAVFWGTVLALTLGLCWAIGRRSNLKLISWPTATIVEFVRSTPLLVQIYFLYYVIPEYIDLRFDPFVVGCFALGLHYSMYTSEVYRAGINAIPRGQWEAARALNFTPFQSYRHIILPQAIPPIIPALGNYVIAMLKDTPLLMAISVGEILRQAKIIGNESFRYLEPMTLVGIAYLIMSLLSGWGISYLETKFKLKKT